MKSLTKLSIAKCFLSLLLVLFIFISCKKEITALKHPENDSHLSALNKLSTKKIKRTIVRNINVENISQLYDAINDSANAESLIILAPGTYILNENYPNAGRLELQFDMQLQGQEGNADQVIIDASLLPGSSFLPPNGIPAPRTGAISLGRGFNSIQWVTVRGNSSTDAVAVIDADLIWEGVSSVQVAHSVITGGNIGVYIRNPGTASIGRILEADISDNEILENLVGKGNGIVIINSLGTSTAIIRATLNGNYVHGNNGGLFSLNQDGNTNTNSNSISIESNADRILDNGNGLFLAASITGSSTYSNNGNTLHFEAHKTIIKNNNTAYGNFVTSGASDFGKASYNRLEMNLWDCDISDNNHSADINAFGAYSLTTFIGGTNNVTEIQLHGVSKQANIVAIPSFPAEPEGTNIVNIILCKD